MDIISLGNWCNSKAVINQYYHPDQDKSMDTKKGESQIFDWMFMCDYEKLIDALDNNLNDIFEKNDLVILQHPFNNTIYNKKYKMIWNHIFQKDNLENYSLSSEIFNIFYTAKKHKLDYLSNKFKNTNSKIYLITINNHSWIPSEYVPVIPTMETIIK